MDIGLFECVTNYPVPLQDVEVEANINVYAVRLRSTLIYCNDSDIPIEVLFKLLVEQSYAVVELTVDIDGRLIKAEIQDSETARKKYDDSIASGGAAVLAEERGKDVLSVALGNLPPHSKAKISLCSVGELSTESDGRVRFSIPAVFKPRYTPLESNDPMASNSSSGCDEQTEHATVPAINTCKLVIDNAEGVTEVTSPTHHIDITRHQGQLAVTVTDRDLTHDLVVLIRYKDNQLPVLTLEYDGNNTGTKGFMSRPAVMFSFFPNFASEPMKCEFIFLVDQSGSMEGEHMGSARETLVLFLKSLPEESFFNVIGFGTKFSPLFDSSRPYDQCNVDTAVEYATKMEASLGETELLPPLKHIFDQGEVPGTARQVFLLTDGAVTNTQDCVSLVMKHAHHTRCFTVGIGSGASSALVEGLARAGNGTAEFVKEGERQSMQAKVIRSLKCALQPPVTDASVKFHHGGHSDKVLLGPASLPPIFNGRKVIIYGVLKNIHPDLRELKGEVVFSGKQCGKPLNFTLPYNFTTDPKVSSKTIHQLAAQAIIQDLESRGMDKHKIVKLSTKSGVLSSYTSFIAVSNGTSTPIRRSMRTWDINPNVLSDGAAATSFRGYFKRSISNVIGSLFSQKPKNRRFQEVAASAVSDDSPGPITPVDLSGTLFEVVRLQLVNGSWVFDDNLPAALGRKREELEGACPKGATGAVWATVLVLSHLRVRYRSRQDEWELIGLKAERWLQRQPLATPLTLEEMFGAATKIL